MSGQRVIAMAGLSGAGKSTLLRAVCRQHDCVHLTASNLIKDQIQIEQADNVTSEKLRSGDIHDNQRLLILGFARHAKETQSPIILDCHTIIDTPAGVQEIPVQTYQALPLTDFFFLEVDPTTILARREADTSRTRPLRTADELGRQQKRAIEVARSAAKQMGIPFSIIRDPNSKDILIQTLSLEQRTD